MISKTTKAIAFVSALFFLPLTATAYHTNLIKGRVGYFSTKQSKAAGSKGSAFNHKINGGAIGEVALTRFITPHIAAEVGIGCAFVKTKASTDTKKKNSNLIPLNALFQFHLPVQNLATPYVGLGYSYNIIQHTKSLKIKHAGNLVYQAGMDLFVFDHVGLNLDVKYSRVKHSLSYNKEKFKPNFKNLTTMAGVTIPF